MKKHKGQSVVEFALVLPLLLIIMFGIIYTGMMFHDYITLSNVARSSAREASVSATDDYANLKQYYIDYHLKNLMTSCYKINDGNPIDIQEETLYDNNGKPHKRVRSTINMQLNINGFFVDMILPQNIGVEYYMEKEPFTTSTSSGSEGG